MGRASRSLVPALLAFATYIVFSGSISPYDIVTGVVVAAAVGLIVANIAVREPWKALDPRRLGWGIAYIIVYFLYSEVRAHLDVMKRILSPSMPINPGIVRVPYRVHTDYAMTSIANSITNTPGTVVVDVDTEAKDFYVHWIDVKATEPEACRKEIMELFEKFSRRVFD